MTNKPNNLLIVEDHSFINKRIAKEAEKIETINDIHISETLEEAFEILKKRNIEIITLDLSLPDGNGLDILLHLKEKGIRMKVFVFSSSSELKKVCLRYGADTFFDKENNFDALINQLKQA